MKRIVIVCMFIINAHALLCMTAETKKPDASRAPIKALQKSMQPVFEHLAGKTWNFDRPSQIINYLILMFEDVEKQSGFPLNPVLVVAAIQELTIDVTKIKDPKTGDTPLHTLFDVKEVDFKTEKIGRAICHVLTLLGLNLHAKNNTTEYGMTPWEYAIASDLDTKYPKFVSTKSETFLEDSVDNKVADNSNSGLGSTLYYGLTGAAGWVWSWAPASWQKTEAKGS